MKLLWTRNPRPGPASRPSTRTPNSEGIAADPRHQPVLVPPPASIDVVPFDLGTCKLLGSPSEAEQSAFDAHLRTHRTRAGFWEHAPVADWMLDVLRNEWHWIPVAPDAALRTFALQTIDGLQGTDAPGLVEVKTTVERRIAGEATTRELLAVQTKTLSMVTPGGVQGLPRCSPHAAGALALWHTANPCPYEAAFWTAEFAALHDAFVALHEGAKSWDLPEAPEDGWRVACYARVHPRVRESALREARERQAVRLKGILPQPFAWAAAPGQPS